MKQLLLFLLLSYLISWVLWLPLYGPVLGITALPYLPYQHAVGAFGPMISCFILTWIFDGKEGLKLLLTKGIKIKPFSYLLIALLAPFALAVLASGISFVVNKKPIDFSGLLYSRDFPDFNFLTLFLYNLVFFGFGEEFGWRGFALPRLLLQWNATIASCVLTIFWAIWHLPLFLYRPGYTGMDVAGVIGWVLSLLTGSILLTWLYKRTGGSILICAVFHSTIDIAFTGNFADQNVVNYMGGLITMWGLFTVFALRNDLQTVPTRTKTNRKYKNSI